ncbi:hypothetical protein DPEC_G00088260 [Dallia pectoralis]|uniref:Uncharacterized protein n=1 Tax=Dallia pectoralis TaxID=75939 RepID=A0ACC2H0D5_DALPE|nr:hypothetical protein DPEC_G00088260 [Dallia pectoralis]
MNALRIQSGRRWHLILAPPAASDEAPELWAGTPWEKVNYGEMSLPGAGIWEGDNTVHKMADSQRSPGCLGVELCSLPSIYPVRLGHLLQEPNNDRLKREEPIGALKQSVDTPGSYCGSPHCVGSLASYCSEEDGTMRGNGSV